MSIFAFRSFDNDFPQCYTEKLYVAGDVAAKEKVELESAARLLGNVDRPWLIIAEVVVLNGCCSMGEARETGEIQCQPRSRR